LLAVARDPGEILAKIDQHFKLKDGSVKSPISYLGADVGKYILPDGTEAWYLSSNTYVKNAIKNVEDWLLKRSPGMPRHHGLKTKAASLFPSGWKPGLDMMDLLEDEDASYYRQQIGVLR
jgi:hypothetical protein